MARLIEIASRLIAKYGQEATLLRAGPGTDDGFGNTVPGPDTAYPVTALVAEYAYEIQAIASAMRFALGEQRVLISVEGLTVEPGAADWLQVDAKRFRVLRAAPLAPAGTVIFWDLAVQQ